MAFPSAGSATTTSFASSVTSMAVNLPASIASGDLLIAIVEVRNSGTWTKPTGWTQLFAPVAAGGVGDLTVFYRICDGTEGSSASWTASVATTASWQVRKITSWDGTAAPEATTVNSGGTPGTNNPPSLTPSWGAADTLWLAVMGTAANGTTITGAPTNYSDLASNSVSSGGGQCNTGSAYRQLNATSEDPGSFTTSADRWWAAATIAIKPAAAGGGGSPQTVTPGVASLSTTGYAPTIKLPKLVIPSLVALSLTTFASTVSVSNNQRVTPISAALSITTYAPTVAISDNKSVVPSAASLTTSSFAPTIALSANQRVTPSVASLTLTTYAPTVAESNNQTVTPDVRPLSLSTFAPSVIVGVRVTPGAAALTSSLYAPTISVSDNKTVTPSTAALSTASSAPTIVVSDNKTVTPTPAAVASTTFAPAIVLGTVVTPDAAALTLTTYAPDIVIESLAHVTPSPAQLTLTTYAPTVKHSVTARKYFIDSDGGVYWVINQALGIVEKI